MINEQLQKKIDFAINLLQHIPSEDIELAFSGGKDSSVILHLAKLAGIMDKCTPIYKNTTIDPKGNVAFCKSQGCEVIRPKKTFFQLIQERGFPTRRARFCCDVLKEYKIKDHVIIGVRKDESTDRAKRYSEPQICRAYGNGGKPRKDRTNVVKQYLPILEWDNQDVYDFLEHYKVDVNTLYTDNYGGGIWMYLNA